MSGSVVVMPGQEGRAVESCGRLSGCTGGALKPGDVCPDGGVSVFRPVAQPFGCERRMHESGGHAFESGVRMSDRDVLMHRPAVQTHDAVHVRPEPRAKASEPGDRVHEPGDRVHEPGDRVNEPGRLLSRSDTSMSGSHGAAHRGDGWSLASAGWRFGSDGGLHGSGWRWSDPDATRTVGRGGISFGSPRSAIASAME